MTTSTPRVVVVGAGLGGLVAAHLLTLGGCAPSVFDAAPSLGGRVRTDHGTLAPSMVTELGGEFIDTAHADMIALARLFGCTPVDTGARSEAGLSAVTRVGGRCYDDALTDQAFAGYAERIRKDAQRLSRRIGRTRHTETDLAFDRLSIDEYLDQIGMNGWLRTRICTEYTTLNGLDSGEQSSITLLQQMCTDPGDFSVFGSSDERWKVAEGLDTLIAGLARGLATPVHTEHRLARIRRRGAHTVLEFKTPGGTLEVMADAIVLAIPFTMLRQVETVGVFSPHKQRAIEQLAYGTNSKLMVGTRQRVWRQHGHTGDISTDSILQCGWDGSRLRSGEQGIYTFFLGGRTGLDIGMSTAEEQARRLSAQANTIWPDFERARTGTVARVHWPSEPWAQASYSTYRPGQRTALGGDESATDGAIYFAGEHCASLWQGYMQGAAETGRACALAILRRATGQSGKQP